MAKGASGKDLLTTKEAAKALGVRASTVRAWMLAGRLKGVVKKVGPIRTESFIKKSSLSVAYDVKCRECGKTFRARVRPRKAAFCSVKHRNAWFGRARTAKNKAAKRKR